MQANELTPERLRGLVDARTDGAKVLSLYLNLDPNELPTPPARQTAVTSLLDEADRRLRSTVGLSHDQTVALRRDLDRVRAVLAGPELPTQGAHALAVFCSGPGDLFELLRLPRPIPNAVVIDDAAHVQPLVDLATGERWCVLLANRRSARIFVGERERLAEVEGFADDVHGQHRQGGLSQERYQRSVEEDAEEHLKRTAEALLRRHQRARIDVLAIAAPGDTPARLEERLHPYLRDHLIGRIEVDIERAGAEDVGRALAPLVDERDRKREREALDRLAQGVGAGGRAAAGLEEVLFALSEQRVRCLLVAEGHRAPGVVCPTGHWLGVEGTRCPVDGLRLERRTDVVEPAMEAAIAQSAEVVVVAHHDDLAAHGSIGALLRF